MNLDKIVDVVMFDHIDTFASMSTLYELTLNSCVDKVMFGQIGTFIEMSVQCELNSD